MDGMHRTTLDRVVHKAAWTLTKRRCSPFSSCDRGVGVGFGGMAKKRACNILTPSCSLGKSETLMIIGFEFPCHRDVYYVYVPRRVRS